MKRSSGRTMHLLEDAFRLAGEGHAVYVACADERQASDLRHRAGREAARLGIRFEPLASLLPSLDLATLRMKGAHANCVLLIDHYAIEQRFGGLLEMHHRYDSPLFEEPSSDASLIELEKLAYKEGYAILYNCIRMHQFGMLTWAQAMHRAAAEQAVVLKELERRCAELLSRPLPGAMP